MSKPTNDLAGYFVHRGAVAARFVENPGGTGDCSTCGRKTLSYPDTCDEGWDRIRAGNLAPCLNFTPGPGETP